MFCCTLLLVIIAVVVSETVVKNQKYVCDKILGGDKVREIQSYENVKNDIFNFVLKGEFKGKAFNELTKFVDKFGARPSGSEVLENSIDFMIEQTRAEGFKHVTTEDVVVPRWQREKERLLMLKPRVKNIAVLALGLSISTPPEGITAEVVVVNNFDELEKMPKSKVKGQIVLFNAIFTTYRETVKYRFHGAVKASEKGAVASLVRSIAPFSINSPHTGTQYYEKQVKKIPTAAISLEDADLIRRIDDRGEKVILNLLLLSKEDKAISRNIIIDIKGRESPGKHVITSAHIDSWDVGEGAMDDGGGIFVTWTAAMIFKRLNLTPRRTLRTIFWTAEEYGFEGAYAYEKAHKAEQDNITFVMEIDSSSFAPRGLIVGGNEKAKCVVREILKMFKAINASTFVHLISPSTDIGVFTDMGIPGATFYNDDPKFYCFHHTEGDSMSVLNPDEMDLATAFWTTVSYIIADLSFDIPRLPLFN